MHSLSVSIVWDLFMAPNFLNSGKTMSNSSTLSSFSKLFFLHYQLKSLKPAKPYCRDKWGRYRPGYAALNIYYGFKKTAIWRVGFSPNWAASMWICNITTRRWINSLKMVGNLWHPDAAAKASNKGAAAGGEFLVYNMTICQLTESGLAFQATVKSTKH